jgi:hypothetical protein
VDRTTSIANRTPEFPRHARHADQRCMQALVFQRRAATHAPFAWIPSHATDLPSWDDLNLRTGRVEKRRLAPNAIVELLAEKTRVFVEDEMGLGPLPRSTENARAWALSKLGRYASFMMQGRDRTLCANIQTTGRRSSFSSSTLKSARRASRRSSLSGRSSTAPYLSSRERSRCGRQQACFVGVSPTRASRIPRSRSSEVS